MKVSRPARVLRQALVVGALLCATLVTAQLFYPEATISASQSKQTFPLTAGTVTLPDLLRHPLLDLLKLVAAFLIGMVLTLMHRATQRSKPFSRSMEHAQVLLCVSGALMMVIIGDSLARAFGIAGAVSIVRFRTPVDDPKDSIILFLSLGLGMAAGLGAFGLAGVGTLFLCLALLCLDKFQRIDQRTMNLALSSSSPVFPTAHVQDVLERNGVEFETREITQGPEAVVRYRVRMLAGSSLEHLSDELRNGTGEIKSVIWEKSKKDK